MLNIDEKSLKHNVLGLVLALVEIIRDALKAQVVRHMGEGNLTEEEVERLGRAMTEVDEIVEEIKDEQGVGEAIRSVRDGLDDIVDRFIWEMVNP